MAGSDEDYLYDIDDEQNNFEYVEGSTNSEAEADAELENQYYNSKLEKQHSTSNALNCFQKVLELQGDKKGEWGFKALKQIIKLKFKTEDYGTMLEKYKELLTYMTTVTRNQSEKAVTGVLNYISVSKNNDLLCLIYEITIDKLKEINSSRLWFKINTKLGKLYYELGQYDKLAALIKQLLTNCQANNGDEDVGQKGSQLLDIYALEIQMYSAQNNFKRLRQIYDKSISIKSSLPYPLTMGIIRECGGKMNLKSADYTKALIDFYEAFKNYDEAGNSKRCTCLKYLILTTMLAKSNINPLDSQDTKQCYSNAEVKPIADLYFAYRNQDLNTFEAILAEEEQSICNDALVKEHIDIIRKNMRISVLLNSIKPYKSIKIPFLSNVLNINAEETENLLVSCILDDIINGKIDQINEILILDEKELKLSSRYKTLVSLSHNINRLHTSVCNEIV